MGEQWGGGITIYVNPSPSQEKNDKNAALGEKYNITHPEITDGRNS
jgi:hypothetical protein